MADADKERARILRKLDRDRKPLVEGDERDWKIIAQSGDDTYLLQTGPDASHPHCAGRILDMSTGMLYHSFNLHSIIARGDWEVYAGSQDILPDLLAQVTRTSW